MKQIKLTGVVGWDMLPEDISTQLEEAAGADLDVYIASPGGSVLDGIEIFNMFRDYKRKYPNSQIVATIKGIAASMATYLALNPAFDLIAAEDNAVFMIHNAWGVSVGDYKEMMKTSEILQGLTNMIADVYKQKTGKSKENILKMMDDETWMFGSEILDAGFIDEIINTDEEKDKNNLIKNSKAEFISSMNRMKDQKLNVEKIAAMIKPEIVAVETTVHTPATAGKNNNGGSTMTLKELLTQNPAAQTEYENNLKEKYEAGKKDGKTEMQSRIDKASPFLDSTEYPEQIRAIALDVVKGEKSVDVLDVMVASADMFKELNKSKTAQGEQPSDTNGEPPTAQPSQSGEINSPADFLAVVENLKKSNGVEVR